MFAKYSSLSGEDISENDSSDRSSDDQIERGKHRQTIPNRTGTFFRIVIEISILAVLLVILLIEWGRAKPDASLNSIIPDCECGYENTFSVEFH